MKRIGFLALPLLGGILVASRAMPRDDAPKFTLPPGFEVEEVLSPDDAGSVVSITFDSQGRMVLAKEFNRIVTLIPTGNGKYEQRVFSDQIHTSQGIFFDGPDLLVDGVGPQGVGLYRVVDENNDARGDRVELIELSQGTIGDHGPHAPLYGPDGYLYWTHGNFSNIYSTVSPLSPVRHYEEAVLLEGPDARGFGNQYNGATGGSFVRKAGLSKLAPQAPPVPAAARGAQPAPIPAPMANQDWELVSMGFRNQYDGAFNLMGELFTYDSDMEWDRDLPWYRPTRTNHVIPGADFGFREGSDKHPAYYFDNLPGTEDLGRGSPTGVMVYNAYNYPRDYWDMVLQSDWSRGRLIGGRIVKDGATYKQTSFNFVYGEPLNVTDVDVGPDGNVYFSLGGRSTGGGIYRVVYKGSDAMPKPTATTPLDRVLTMIQPRSAFSRQLAKDVKTQMGDRNWERALTAVVRNAGASPERRVRALELLQVFGPVPDEALLNSLRGDAAWEVRAASTYYLGLKPTDSARGELVARLKDSDAFVQRRAAEALLRTGVNPTMSTPINAVQDVMPLLSSPDRWLRYSARTLLRQIDPNQWKEAAYTSTSYPQAPEALMAYIQTITSPDVWSAGRVMRRELELLQANPTDAQLLDLVRLIQRTILKANGVTNIAAGKSAPGNMQAMQGERPQGPPQQGGQRPTPPANTTVQIGQLLLARFPSADSMLNREMARVFAALETQGAVPKLTAELSKPSNGREQQIHMAYMLSFMKTGWDAQTEEPMAAWLEKVYSEGWKGGAGFAPAINLIRDRWLGNIPVAQNPQLTQRLEGAEKKAQAALAAAAGAAMAAGGFNASAISDEEAFEELVYNPNVTQGSAAGGVIAYQKATCINCHTFGPLGQEFGPDLSTVGQRFSRKDLVEAVIHPDAVVSDQYHAEEITRNNGTKVLGVARDDGNNVVVQIAGGREVTIPRSDIRSRAASQKSPMPAGLLNLLSATERRNLFLLLQAGPSAIPDSALARIGVSR